MLAVTHSQALVKASQQKGADGKEINPLKKVEFPRLKVNKRSGESAECVEFGGIKWIVYGKYSENESKRIEVGLRGELNKAIFWADVQYAAKVLDEDTVSSTEKKYGIYTQSTSEKMVKIDVSDTESVEVLMTLTIKRIEIHSLSNEASEKVAIQPFDKSVCYFVDRKLWFAYKPELLHTDVNSVLVVEHKEEVLLIVLQRFYGILVDFERVERSLLPSIAQLAKQLEFNRLLSEIDIYLSERPGPHLQNEWSQHADSCCLYRVTNAIFDGLSKKQLLNFEKESGLTKLSTETMHMIISESFKKRPVSEI
ncbi:hypothetical protein L596_017325 [Steinernema carpocapsae]|uniref:Uncharacterized protein n=1 Tax=Steinernema carpocapsae TaxID=34508 RepID=A0A4U5N1N9_STECR|nr:hypothetical protein L596_017325 [Steinernema carpocapsae]